MVFNGLRDTPLPRVVHIDHCDGKLLVFVVQVCGADADVLWLAVGVLLAGDEGW